MNNKGQALVEFILILPLILIILFGMIEFGNLIHQKYLLETYMDTAIDIYKNNKDELLDNVKKDKNIDVKYTTSSNLVTITISKQIKLITPGLDLVLEDPYTIKTERSFYYDQDERVDTSTPVPTMEVTPNE